MADARVTQAVVEVLTWPQAAARVTQAPVEILGTSVAVAVATEGRVTQAVVELLSESPAPPPPTLRITQLVVETWSAAAAAARTTQAVVELWTPVSAPTRTTHAVVELWNGTPATTDVTQAIVELWTVPGVCPDVYPFLPACAADIYPVLPTAGTAVYPIDPEAGLDRYPVPPESGLDLYPVLPETEEAMDASTFIVNMALQEIGISKPITSLTEEGSQEAACARLIYTEVVDTVLRDHPWGFATEYADLVWEAGSIESPVNADWYYTYELPDDCVRVRRVCLPADQRRYTVTPIPFDLRASPDGSRDILMCNEPGGGQLALTDPPLITIEYTKRFPCLQVNDAQFREAVVMKMAARLAKALARDSKDADRALRNYALALPKGQTQHANDSESQRPINAPPDWIEGR